MGMKLRFILSNSILFFTMLTYLVQSWGILVQLFSVSSLLELSKFSDLLSDAGDSLNRSQMDTEVKHVIFKPGKNIYFLTYV
jgi:hypothetical protein